MPPKGTKRKADDDEQTADDDEQTAELIAGKVAELIAGNIAGKVAELVAETVAEKAMDRAIRLTDDALAPPILRLTETFVEQQRATNHAHQQLAVQLQQNYDLMKHVSEVHQHYATGGTIDDAPRWPIVRVTPPTERAYTGWGTAQPMRPPM